MFYLDVAEHHKNSYHNYKFVHLPLPMNYFLPMTKMQSWAISICQKINIARKKKQKKTDLKNVLKQVSMKYIFII